MPIDENRKPFLLVCRTKAPYFKKEVFKDSDGSECVRQVQCMGESEQTRNYQISPEWEPIRKWSEIIEKNVYKVVDGSMESDSISFEKKSAIILVSYLVDVTKCKYLQNSIDGKNYVYLKECPSGLYARDFSCDVTTFFPPNKTLIAHHVYEVLSEKEITANKAKELIRSGTHCGNLGLRARLGFGAV